MKNSKADSSATATSFSIRSIMVDTGHSGVRLALFLGTLFLLLAMLASWTRGQVAESMHAQLARQLQSALRADISAFETWIEHRELMGNAMAQVVGGDGPAAALLSHDVGPVELAQVSEQDEIARMLAPYETLFGFQGYVLMDVEGVVAATNLLGYTVGEQPTPFELASLAPALQGQARVLSPYQRGEAEAPTMAVMAALYDAANQPIGALLLPLARESSFSAIHGGQRGKTGESYVFDERGLMLSESRFKPELRTAGLLGMEDDTAVLRVPLRVPGSEDYTALVRSALEGGDGVDTSGYKNYLGMDVIGAWAWLEHQQIGVAVEINSKEALGPLTRLEFATWVLLGVVAFAAVAVAVIYLVMLNILERRDAPIPTVNATVGSYTLEEKIGEGGMGEVYRASHEHLRRQTAVKIIRADRRSQNAVDRFEREVQICSELNHPNTVSIYDYGRTTDGLFYYAMEYLPGHTLAQLLRKHGPQPSGRVAQLLLQVCGSLAEAHTLGLVHRDIKPANLILCERGRIYDVLKVLDFGLAKPLDEDDDNVLTRVDALLGTPRYTAPELFLHQDASPASDIYAVGAVGYELITGRPLFEGGTVAMLMNAHINERPVPPSGVHNIQGVDPVLERMLLQCLEKEPDARPSAEELASALRRCESIRDWTQDDARRWWITNTGSAQQSIKKPNIVPRSPETIILPPA